MNIFFYKNKMDNNFNEDDLNWIVSKIRNSFESNENLNNFIIKIWWFTKISLDKKIKDNPDWFNKKYFGLLWILDTFEVKKENIILWEDHIYYLKTQNIQKGLKCPHCCEWNIGLFEFVCINSHNTDDVFVIELLRCTNHAVCGFISVEKIDKLKNKLITKKIEQAKQRSETMKQKMNASKQLQIVTQEKIQIENENNKLRDELKINSFMNILKWLFKEKPVPAFLSLSVFVVAVLMALGGLIFQSNYKFSVDILKWKVDMVNKMPQCVDAGKWK